MGMGSEAAGAKPSSSVPRPRFFQIHSRGNAGNREEEACSLKWAWERKVPELETSVFVIPGDKVKKRGGSIGGVESDREIGSGGSTRDASGVRFRAPGKKWSRQTDQENVRHRLEECAGASRRRLGEISWDCSARGIQARERITTHYSEAELANLIAAAEKVCDQKSRYLLGTRSSQITIRG